METAKEVRSGDTIAEVPVRCDVLPFCCFAMVTARPEAVSREKLRKLRLRG